MQSGLALNGKSYRTAKKYPQITKTEVEKIQKCTIIPHLRVKNRSLCLAFQGQVGQRMFRRPSNFFGPSGVEQIRRDILCRNEPFFNGLARAVCAIREEDPLYFL